MSKECQVLCRFTTNIKKTGLETVVVYLSCVLESLKIKCDNKIKQVFFIFNFKGTFFKGTFFKGTFSEKKKFIKYISRNYY